MNYKNIFRIISQILALEALFMLPSIIISFFDGDLYVVKSFIYTIAIILVVSIILFLLGKNSIKKFSVKEGLVCVGIGWVIMSLFGAIPFVLSNSIPNYIDAVFETASGFTTTGASILSEVESLSRGILYWRSFTHWLGGMGVLVFIIAIIPRNDKGPASTLNLMRAESTGPSVGKIVPKMKNTAIILYSIYIFLTLLNFILLMFGDMNWFEALCTAFGTAGTGGFGVRNDSLTSFSPYVQYVTTVFMILFGVNFSCYYWILVKQIKNVFKNEEFRVYIGIVVSAIALIILNTYKIFPSFSDAFRIVSFQVASLISTTGYSTADFNLWPSFSKFILFILMFIGASGGSTAGGVKVSRVIIFVKSVGRNIKSYFHPQTVKTIRINNQPINEKIVTNTNIYFLLYFLIYILSTLIISIDGFSFETNVTAVMATLNNIGPGFDAVGATQDFMNFSILSKIVLIFDMLAGRLELFPIIVLSLKSTWKD